MTAPHGPSEAVVLAFQMYPAKHPITLYRDDLIGALTAAWPTIVSEVRAAVVAECAHVLKAESDRRFRERTTDDSLGRAFDGGIAGAADILLGIEKARALLPPVSAPGSTLPEGGRQDVDLSGDLRAAALASFASRAERGPDAGRGEG